MAFTTTFLNLLRETFGHRSVVGLSAEKERAAYDASSEGDGAPHTDWISTKSLHSFCSQFSKFSAKTENIDQEKPFQYFSRSKLLKTKIPHIMGLDLYATAIK